MVRTEALRLGLLASCLAAVFSGRTAHAEDLTYSTDIKPLLDSHCIECHHEGGRRPNLSQFPFPAIGLADDQDAIVRRILVKIDAARPSMPPGARPKLSADEVTRISTWREQGLNP